WAERLEELLPKVQEVKDTWEQLTGLWYEQMERSAGGQGDGYVLRLRPDKLPDKWEDGVLMEDNIYMNLTEICRELDKVLSKMKESDVPFELQSMVTDMTGLS